METRGAYSRRRFLLGSVAVAAAIAVPSLSVLTPGVGARSTDTMVVNTAGSRLRSGAGTGYAVLASLAKGTEVRYLADGGTANGCRWYKVMVLATGKQGFVAASLLSAPGGGGNTGPFAIGTNFWVKVANANLRAQAGTSANVLKVLPLGSQGTVADGPVTANGYTWYQVTVGSSVGWVATVVMGSAPGNPGIPYNVTVTDGPLNVRQYPTTSSAVVGKVQTGHRGWLTQRTFVQADGHQWAEVTFESGKVLHGYVSTKYVKIT